MEETEEVLFLPPGLGMVGMGVHARVGESQGVGVGCALERQLTLGPGPSHPNTSPSSVISGVWLISSGLHFLTCEMGWVEIVPTL